MSLKGYAPALWLDCRANGLLRALYTGFSLLCLLSLWWTPWAWWLRVVCLILLFGLLWHGWRQRCELGGRPLLLHWDEDGQWWQGADPDKQPLRLDGESLLSPWLVVLRFRRPLHGRKNRLAIILTPAAIGAETYRKLILRLHWQDPTHGHVGDAAGKRTDTPTTPLG